MKWDSIVELERCSQVRMLLPIYSAIVKLSATVNLSAAVTLSAAVKLKW